jgi:hypothetical protein
MDRWCRLVQDDHQLSGLLAGLDLAELRREEELFVAGLLAAPGARPPARPGTEVLSHLAPEDRRRLDSYLLQALVEEGVQPTVIMRVGDALAAAAPHGIPPTDAVTPRPRRG